MLIYKLTKSQLSAVMRKEQYEQLKFGVRVLLVTSFKLFLSPFSMLLLKKRGGQGGAGVLVLRRLREKPLAHVKQIKLSYSCT